MRLAILSDVHSNIHALRAVLENLDDLGGADMTACAGDTVGYGAYPNECCDSVRANSRRTVIGNHDRTALDGDTFGMNPYAARAASWTKSQLNASSTGWLSRLQPEERFKLGNSEFCLFHGSPRSVTEYVYEEDVTEQLLSSARCSVLVLGHTHIPFVRRFRSGIVVNPGSIGQPRDGDPRASFAILESDSLACKIVRTEYDVEAAAKAILDAGLPGLLADRLSDGR